MTLLPVFQWLGQTSAGVTLRDSRWGFPIVETVHLLALAILGGTILIVDLRLLGLGPRRQPASRLAGEMSRYFLWSLAAMLGSGVLLVASESLRCYYNPAFRWKMALLPAAIAFHLTLRRKAISSDAENGRTRLAGGVSLALWLAVGVAGRTIGLL